MDKTFLKDSLGWGLVLWLFGYALGFLFFVFVPTAVMGWYIMPFGIALTLLVLHRYVQGSTLPYYLKIGIIWALLAVALDYIFIVQMLHPTDGYYKLDVYLYYLLTLALPPASHLLGFKRA